MKQQKQTTAAGMVAGMAAGAALGAAGMYLADRNKREVKRAAKKIARGAESALQTVDRVVTEISSRM